MKKIALVFCLLPAFVIAQKIKVSEKDKFLKKYRIETGSTFVKDGMGGSMRMGFRSVDSTIFLHVSGTNVAAGVIGAKDQIIFLMENDSTITCTSTGLQDYRVGQYGKSYEHEYYITTSDVKTLQELKVKSIRVYFSSGYEDVDIREGKADKLKGEAGVFFAEYTDKILGK